ncbi:polyprenyl synthetase family protein [Weissella muntiaci]|uniref:Farnesyl diphosphate synthase n=1 Tax=Weissella muntiaci TaxID=2508881 RepID=A0A6C2C499_9LACO|nr:polyprenyl synthetase family protein [Weissella muntiaci]TYC48393.1 polyprenyl synthetase family protein [Weissella muntiaci]
MRLAGYAELVRPELEQMFQTSFDDLGDGSLIDAMRYAVTNGGKRIRPLLTLAVAETFGQKRQTVMMNAGAVELIHTYSLIHDDLPAMDNDDVRRGQPTTHVKYSEDLAILAGDALQPLAFEWLTVGDTVSTQIKVQLVQKLAQAAGPQGMVAGQVLDMAATNAVEIDLVDVIKIHNLKTGALIAYSAEAGGILADVDVSVVEILRRFGLAYGLAFQIQDDLNDLEQDGDEDKQSYPAILGYTGAKKALAEQVALAHAALIEIQQQTRADIELLVSFLDYFDKVEK